MSQAEYSKKVSHQDLGEVEMRLVLGKAADAMQGVAAKLEKQFAKEAAQTAQPVFYHDATNGTVDTGGHAVLSFPSPTQGYVHEIRNLVVSLANPSSTDAADAFVFVAPVGGLTQVRATSSGGIMQALGAVSLRDLTTAGLPWVRFYSSGQLVVKANENLCVVVRGATSGDVVVVNFSGIVLQEGLTKTSTII